MKPSTNNFIRLRRNILELGFTIKRNLPTALDRAERDCQGGFPDRNGEPLGVMSSDTTDSTASLALGSRDEIAHRRDMLFIHLREAERHLKLARTDMFFLIGLSQEEAQRLVEQQAQKMTNCLNCGHVVTRIGEDRLIKDRCRSCYDHLKNNGIDREIVERGAKKMFGTLKPGMAR